jgi:hypothetical protein
MIDLPPFPRVDHTNATRRRGSGPSREEAAEETPPKRDAALSCGAVYRTPELLFPAPLASMSRQSMTDSPRKMGVNATIVPHTNHSRDSICTDPLLENIRWYK